MYLVCLHPRNSEMFVLFLQLQTLIGKKTRGSQKPNIALLDYFSDIDIWLICRSYHAEQFCQLQFLSLNNDMKDNT